jgi:acrylyl-CoA reductase (NADPH)
MAGIKALLLEEEQGKVRSRIAEIGENALPPGDVTVAVRYSTLNYKDGMVLRGIGRLVRTYPHVPGIDFAGTVERSDVPEFKPGDNVVLTGWRVGELRWGGYAQKARVNAQELVPLPPGLSLKHAMTIGTAGFTAMLAVMALEAHGTKPGEGDVLVTGAAGGLGSVAVALLARLGHRVTASTGRSETRDYLHGLGAASVIERASLAVPPDRPLLPERWTGAIDSVGGSTLARLLAELRYGASVAACGLAGGSDYPGSVIPFLLRGVNVLGIDSVMCPIERRRAAWARLAHDLTVEALDAMTETVGLEDLTGLATRILEGGVRGRIVVDLAL